MKRMENREVGKTNSAGKLLVPDVRSFDRNHIAIVSTDIPVDATIDDASRTFRHATSPDPGQVPVIGKSAEHAQLFRSAAQCNVLLTVKCTNTTVFNIGLNAGNSPGATVTTPKMTGPASATLNYNLFRNSGLTQNWGMTVGTDTLSSTRNFQAQNFSVYGQIPSGQFVAPGTYNDTIIATITY